MRIKRFSFRNIFLIFVFLTVQLVAVNINSNSFVSEIRLEEESGISTSFPIDSIRSLSKTSSKKFIEYHMSDFTNESSKDFINAVVIFNEDVIWNFPDMTFTYKYKYLNGFRASIPIGMFNNFRQASFIKYIYEKDHNNASLDGNDELHYGVDNTQAERVWGGEENAVDVIPGYPAGQGAKVAVMDSGIDYYHSDLNENYKGGYDFAGYNHINDNDPMDFWDDGNKGHGTHVAGIIGAADNELDVIGVAPKVDLYALKVFGLYWDVLEARNKTYFGDDDLAMEWAIEHDMDIVSMSFGPLYFQAFHDLCDIAYSKGITLVASAGNDANDDPHYPSDYSTVIRVGAVDKYNNFASAFSNYGPYQELVAPGGKTWLQQRIKSDQLGGGTRKVSGTSQACPMVSGVCALLHSVTPDIMPDEIRYILHNTAYDRGDPGWDEYYGWGTVDAEAAVNMAQTTDSDSDGIIDLLENNVWFTNPNLPDTDGDGLNDCLEVRTYFSDPNEQDTDKDGLDDLSEANDYNTDLNDVDTDNDGYNDPIEVILDFDPLDNSHHPLQSFFYEDGVGATHSWSATDSPYNVVTPDADLEGYDCIKNHEATSHYGYYMFAESPAIDLSSWTGDNDLHITFRFRCQSNTQSSSITQFALRFYNALTQTRVFFENPTIYNYYLVHQGNRNGQTWIDGYDSGWQTISFTLLASEFSQFAGTNDRLKVQWGHVDSYSDYWYQREYLDYLQITEEENTIIPDPPRDLNGIGDGIKHIALYWKSPLNVLATKYKIQRKVEGVYTHQAEVDHVGTIYQTQYWNDPEELEFGITYYYRVNAFNDQIVGSYAYWSGTVGFGLLSNGSSIQIISSSHFESITHQLIFFELAFIFCLNLLGIVSIFNKKKSCF